MFSFGTGAPPATGETAAQSRPIEFGTRPANTAAPSGGFSFGSPTQRRPSAFGTQPATAAPSSGFSFRSPTPISPGAGSWSPGAGSWKAFGPRAATSIPDPFNPTTPPTTKKNSFQFSLHVNPTTAPTKTFNFTSPNAKQKIDPEQSKTISQLPKTATAAQHFPDCFGKNYQFTAENLETTFNSTPSASTTSKFSAVKFKFNASPTREKGTATTASSTLFNFKPPRQLQKDAAGMAIATTLIPLFRRRQQHQRIRRTAATAITTLLLRSPHMQRIRKRKETYAALQKEHTSLCLQLARHEGKSRFAIGTRVYVSTKNAFGKITHYAGAPGSDKYQVMVQKRLLLISGRDMTPMSFCSTSSSCWKPSCISDLPDVHNLDSFATTVSSPSKLTDAGVHNSSASLDKARRAVQRRVVVVVECVKELVAIWKSKLPRAQYMLTNFEKVVHKFCPSIQEYKHQLQKVQQLKQSILLLGSSEQQVALQSIQKLAQVEAQLPQMLQQVARCLMADKEGFLLEQVEDRIEYWKR